MTEARELYLKMFSTVLMLFSRLLRATRPSVPITRSRPLNTAHTAAAMSQLFIRTLTGKNFQFDDLDFDTVTIGDLKRQVSEGAATAMARCAAGAIGVLLSRGSQTIAGRPRA